MVSDPGQPARRLPVIGLLGAPGSGKSTIARMFANSGCAVIDADQLSRDAFEDHAIQATLVEWWGEGVVREGKVDRSQIGEIVFADPEQRARLEGLVHPYVNRRRAELREAIERDAAGGAVAIVEDCPLLLEVGLDGGCDRLVFVDCPLAIRRQRVLESRGWSADELAAREAAQWPLDTKRARADYTVSNVGDKKAIQAQVDSVLTDIRQSFTPTRANRC
ncbi:MAG: dephospho-CoA kinase [Phycisphaerales bacterium JB063]